MAAVLVVIAALLVVMLPHAGEGAPATPQFVQARAKEVTSGTANSLAFSSANTAGNLIVAYVIWGNSNSVSLSDSRGNAYASAIARTTWNGTWSAQVFYAKNVAGGSNTVTATFATAITSFAVIYIHEYAGIDKVNPLDVSKGAIGTARAMSSGSVTTTNANDLLFGAGASKSSVTKGGTGYTVRSSASGNLTEDRNVISTGSYAATATQNSNAWVMQLVAFRADPGETTPPAVSITAPANNAQVSDIVMVTADASDNVGVAGVQFLVDGVATGLEDTIAPYGLSWDTRTVANGAHTLTARARDTSGNTALSAPVTVNVANANHFQNEILATGFDLPTSIEFLPDGRMLVVELQGKIKVLPPPYTQPDPALFLQITNIGSAGVQQGIFDIVLDPAFATNHFYYVFYTAASPNRDRLSRFTANATNTGTIAGSELVLYQDSLVAENEHHGGALNFGNDGKLYFTTGEQFMSESAQDLTSPRGKIHRINPDGTVPGDNPFFDGTGPNWDSVWALGLRNPFRAYYDAPTGRFYVGDVGGNDYSVAKEEVNLGVRGANYGWPDSEGPCSAPCASPLYSYPHNSRDASVTGGFVYHGSQFPSSYQGSYFFADYTQNWIRRLTFDAGGNVNGVFNFEPADGTVDGPYGDIVYLAEGPDGALYYVDLGYSDIGGTFGVSKIRRIRYLQSDQAPVAVASASPTSGPAPLAVSFSSAGRRTRRASRSPTPGRSATAPPRPRPTRRTPTPRPASTRRGCPSPTAPTPPWRHRSPSTWATRLRPTSSRPPTAPSSRRAT
jgi:glucose/arabinose dehydrogenase